MMGPLRDLYGIVGGSVAELARPAHLSTPAFARSACPPSTCRSRPPDFDVFWRELVERGLPELGRRSAGSDRRHPAQGGGARGRRDADHGPRRARPGAANSPRPRRAGWQAATTTTVIDPLARGRHRPPPVARPRSSAAAEPGARSPPSSPARGGGDAGQPRRRRAAPTRARCSGCPGRRCAEFAPAASTWSSTRRRSRASLPFDSRGLRPRRRDRRPRLPDRRATPPWSPPPDARGLVASTARRVLAAETGGAVPADDRTAAAARRGQGRARMSRTMAWIEPSGSTSATDIASRAARGARPLGRCVGTWLNTDRGSSGGHPAIRARRERDGRLFVRGFGAGDPERGLRLGRDRGDPARPDRRPTARAWAFNCRFEFGVASRPTSPPTTSRGSWSRRSSPASTDDSAARRLLDARVLPPGGPPVSAGATPQPRAANGSTRGGAARDRPRRRCSARWVVFEPGRRGITRVEIEAGRRRGHGPASRLGRRARRPTGARSPAPVFADDVAGDEAWAFPRRATTTAAQRVELFGYLNRGLLASTPATTLHRRQRRARDYFTRELLLPAVSPIDAREPLDRASTSARRRSAPSTRVAELARERFAARADEYDRARDLPRGGLRRPLRGRPARADGPRERRRARARAAAAATRSGSG